MIIDTNDSNKIGIAEKMIKAGDWSLMHALEFLQVRPHVTDLTPAQPQVFGPGRHEPFQELNRISEPLKKENY